MVEPTQQKKPRRQAIHQFHSGSAYGDAVTNSMILTRAMLNSLGFVSDIFVEHIAPELGDKIKSYTEWNASADDVLLLHHSMGHDLDPWVSSLEAKKFLVYHNITPQEFFPPESPLRHYSSKGREQLHTFRTGIRAAIADSEFNAEELRSAGYTDVEVIPLLIDVPALQQRPWNSELVLRQAPMYTVLFVGRIAANKCQHDLVAVAAWLNKMLVRPFQVVCVGGFDAGDSYFQRVVSDVHASGLDGCFHFTGKISEADLYGWYRAADAFVCLSEHEGFGVPLIEAMAFDVPVIASRTSNIESTLGGAGFLVADKNHAAIAGLLCVLAEDGALRRAVVSEQRSRLWEFSQDSLARRLAAFLDRQGIAIPNPSAEQTYDGSARLRYQIEGPFETSYSLAIINRELALALDREASGRVGLFATEGPGNYAPDVAAIEAMPNVAKLWRRGQPGSRADVVVRNLYPPRVGDMDGLINFLYFGWEESGLPIEFVSAFNARLDGVCALSEYVGKVLIDNGVNVPSLAVHCGVDHIERIQPLTFPLQTGDAFVFLHVSSCFPRKGVDVLLNAYMDRFTKDDNVVLLIKTFPNPHNTVRDQLASHAAKVSKAPHVLLIEDDLSPGQMRYLFDRCQAFVAPTRGEGFGLPMAEAMWLGKPVITTAYGGQADFCNDANSWLVDFSFGRAATHMRMADSIWLEPDQAHLGELMRELFESPAERLQPKVEKAQLLVRAEYTWDRTAAKVQQLERFVAAQQPLAGRCIRVAWVSSWNSKCGIAMYSKFIVEQFDQREFGIGVFASISETPLSDDGEDVFRCWTDHSGSIDGLLENLDRYAPNVIVVQFNFGFISVANLSRLILHCELRRVVIIVIFHSTRPVDSESLKASLKSIAGELARADRLLVHGIDDLNRLKSYGLVRNTALLPHGVPDWRSIPALLNSDDSVRPSRRVRWKIATYGFLLPHKGLEEIVDAVSLLRGRRIDIELTMVNAIYPIKTSQTLFEALHERVVSLGLRDFVAIHSDFLPDEESLGLLRAADLLVFPYTQTAESSSAAVRFGLATGLPVACSPLEIFRDVHDVVHTLPGTTAHDLADGIELLLANPVLLASKSSTQDEWLDAHAWTNISRRMGGIIRGLYVKRMLAYQ